VRTNILKTSLVHNAVIVLIERLIARNTSTAQIMTVCRITKRVPMLKTWESNASVQVPLVSNMKVLMVKL